MARAVILHSTHFPGSITRLVQRLAKDVKPKGWDLDRPKQMHFGNTSYCSYNFVPTCARHGWWLLEILDFIWILTANERVMLVPGFHIIQQLISVHSCCCRIIFCNIHPIIMVHSCWCIIFLMMYHFYANSTGMIMII